MIDGLKAAFDGAEIIRSLNARIEAARAAIEYKRDEIAGKVLPAGDRVYQMGAEEVEGEIRDIEHTINVLTLFRDRVLPGTTYLLGRKDLKRAGLMPERPAPPEFHANDAIRLVTRAY